ncbi:MAG: flagellar hook-basal body complex protein FliE [Planctomycetota bacterium]|nr:flagellar hook-basal body complex protein FliE [Planctomycetota bacterium]
MSDPVGLIRSTGNAGGPTNLGPLFSRPRAVEGQHQAFRDVLVENLDQVNKLQQDATRAIEDLQTGERTDVEGVILATQKADSAFRMLQSLRNRLMEAYDEIKQVRV